MFKPGCCVFDDGVCDFKNVTESAVVFSWRNNDIVHVFSFLLMNQGHVVLVRVKFGSASPRECRVLKARARLIIC